MSEPVRLNDVRCIRETDKALLVLVEGVEEWIPKSQVHDDSEVFREGDEGTLVVSAWIAGERGWE